MRGESKISCTIRLCCAGQIDRRHWFPLPFPFESRVLAFDMPSPYNLAITLCSRITFLPLLLV
jgi:hypothetical protein